MTLSFVVFLNTEELLTLVVVDTKPYFQSSKTFYINFSYQQVESYLTFAIIPPFSFILSTKNILTQ